MLLNHWLAGLVRPLSDLLLMACFPCVASIDPERVFMARFASDGAIEAASFK